MKLNMGSADRIIRLAIAIVIGVLFFTGILKGFWAAALLIIGGIFLVTAVLGVCPAYVPFGFNTCSLSKRTHYDDERPE